MGAVPDRAEWTIPFNEPSIEGREIEHIREAIAHGHTSAKGPFSARVVDLLGGYVDAQDVLLTTSCTAALEMSGLLLDIEPGDVVIVPSFAYVTSALAFVRAGARVLFADIEPETLGIDPASVEELLEPSVKAVLAIHYAGIGCDLEGLTEVLERHPEVDLVEDNAHGLFGTYRNRPLGSFGRFTALSFHETKNFVCGEGGALIVNRQADMGRAHVLYDKGTDREAFLLGQVDKYSWRDLGSSFGMSDLLAAYLLGQLEVRERILEKRRRVFDRYVARLGPNASELGYRIPVVPSDRAQAFHMFYVLLPDRVRRDGALAALTGEGIRATFHYVPLHDAPAAERFAARATACPVSEDVSGRLLRFPFYNSLADEDIDRICEIFLEAARSG
jgi:dTDP-4-amino-4,6-dideoxygalactose transaminase